MLAPKQIAGPVAFGRADPGGVGGGLDQRLAVRCRRRTPRAGVPVALVWSVMVVLRRVIQHEHEHLADADHPDQSP
jgi:hypothetical protein